MIVVLMTCRVKLGPYKKGLFMKRLAMAALALVALSAMGAGLLMADCSDGNFKWGNMSTSDDTSDSVPPGATVANSDSLAGTASWTWSITGSKGSFTGHANAENAGSATATNRTTGTHARSGFLQVLMGNWDEGTLTCKPPAPANARVTGQGDATVVGSVSMDAGTGFQFNPLKKGFCQTLAQAKVTFSGVAEGSIDLNLNPSFSEKDTTIGGSMSITKTPGATVNISGSISANMASAAKTDSISLTKDFDGNIAGKLQKGFGEVGILATANNGATDSTADASTSITLVKLANPSGGTVKCGEATCNVAGVATAQLP